MFQVKRFCRIASAALILSGAAGQAVAAPPATAFTYQGQVKQAGTAMNGSVPMSFTLWDDAVGGNQVGAALTFNGLGANPPSVAVANGLFTVALDFGAAAFADGQQRWLEITVNGQTLTPRQAMTPAPFALNTRGITVNAAGNAGLGSANPLGKLEIQSGDDTNLFQNQGAISMAFFMGGFRHWIRSVHDGLDAANSLDFFVNSSNTPEGSSAPGVGNTLAMSLKGNGWVGIGTPTPTNPLTVIGNSDFNGSMVIQQDSSQPDPGQLVIRHASHPGSQLLIGYSSNGSGEYGSIEAIHQGWDFMPLCLNPLYGNVGVGTTQPNVPFHVVSHNSLPNVRFSAGPESIYGSFLSLDATAQPGGKDWWMFSTGGQAGEGQGLFVLKNQSANQIAMTVSPNGNFGLGATNLSSFRLIVNGTAANSTGSWSIFSDARLKQNITALTPGTLDKVLSLHGAEFEYTPEAVRDRHVAPGRTVGFIAPDVEKVFPEWVSTDADGYRYITERGSTALMVEALRELRAEKDAQIAQLNAAHGAEIQTLQQRHDAEVAGLAARLTRLEALLNK